MSKIVAAHQQAESHHYLMHFPPHPARTDDPHYADFDHYHRLHRATARCFIGERIGFGDCKDSQCHPCPPPEGDGEQPGLELHHAHVEFSLQNGVDLAALEKDFPGISDPSQVGAWVESDANFRWLCAWHHRGAAGAHTASHSDWEASQYVQGLITRAAGLWPWGPDARRPARSSTPASTTTACRWPLTSGGRSASPKRRQQSWKRTPTTHLSSC